MKENGLTTKQKALASISTQTEQDMKAIGKPTNKMGMVKRAGLTELFSKELTSKERRRGLEPSIGLTDPRIKEVSRTTTLKVRAFTSGQIRGCSKVTGLTEKCTAKENLPGLTAGNTLVITSTTKKKEKANSLGMTDANMKASGKKESSTESECSRQPTASSSSADGKTAREPSGFKKVNITYR